MVDELVADHLAQRLRVVGREDLLEHPPGDLSCSLRLAVMTPPSHARHRTSLDSWHYHSTPMSVPQDPNAPMTAGAPHPGEPTRARVVAAATRVFLQHGYAGATIPAIAAEAGVALQTVYRAAPGKASARAALTAAVAGGANAPKCRWRTDPPSAPSSRKPDPRRQLAAVRAHPARHLGAGRTPVSGPGGRGSVGAGAAQGPRGTGHPNGMAGLVRSPASWRGAARCERTLTPARAADLIVTLGSLGDLRQPRDHPGLEPRTSTRTWLADMLAHALLR